jgi:hypothetical protein
MKSAADEYVTMAEASRLGVVGMDALRRRVRTGDLPVFVDGRDVRRKMIRVADLERLAEIRPAPTARETVTAGSSAAT